QKKSEIDEAEPIDSSRDLNDANFSETNQPENSESVKVAKDDEPAPSRKLTVDAENEQDVGEVEPAMLLEAAQMAIAVNETTAQVVEQSDQATVTEAVQNQLTTT